MPKKYEICLRLSAEEKERLERDARSCGLSKTAYPREPLLREKAEVYQRLAEVNRQIRQERQKLALCREIQKEAPKIAKTIQPTMEPEKEVNRDECRRR